MRIASEPGYKPRGLEGRGPVVKRRKVLLVNASDLIGVVLQQEIAHLHRLAWPPGDLYRVAIAPAEDFDPAAVVQMVKIVKPNLLVLPLPQAHGTGTFERLLDLFPDLHVFAMSTKADCGVLYRRKLSAKLVVPASSTNILNTIRKANSVFYRARKE